ncbi:hypothetical protein [Lacimicrobium alkaliphilum]|uniref:Pentapeptide MXKDX repeat protein n=1 Tax=Lacimicrobium alkaliphilum TaxID=1526571 RepID=A0A0U2ZMA4_9ALTE|nr:hypothetical protein [Lacimicrobium alkaliphilum]ALS99436.1 hypothetical protein AT746_15000 [Lacimicrobium alkaliphilum]
MKTQLVVFAAILPYALSVHAHDPKEHMKNAEAPDCAAMKNMDHEEMDMNDPVMQAMMKKCMKMMHHNEKDSHEDHAKKDTQKTKEESTKDSGHEHKKH